MKNTYTGKNEQEYAQKLINSIPIIHVYGSLGELPWQNPNSNDTIPYDINETLAKQERDGKIGNSSLQFRKRNSIIIASRNIEIMPNQSDKPAETDKFIQARKKIESAQVLFFLGFGYHSTNLTRLGINSLRIDKNIRGTSLGLSFQRKVALGRLGISTMTWDKARKNPRGLYDEDVYEFLHQHAILD